MKITLSRDEISAILSKEARLIGEAACPQDQAVLAVKVPDFFYSSDCITIEIGAPSKSEDAGTVKAATV